MLAGYLEYLNTTRVILGSKSTPRKSLLESSGLKFEIMDSEFEEDLAKENFETPNLYVKATSYGKEIDL